MKVYHGSDVKIEIIDLSKCRIGTDFGHGFYVTKFFKQAEDIAARIYDYLNGDVTKVEFIEELRFKKPMHQICFCSVASLQMLSLLANKNDSKILQMKDLLVEQLMIDNQIDETQAADIFYNSETFAQLADESTEFYKKSWQEIYEMLKKEGEYI